MIQSVLATASKAHRILLVGDDEGSVARTLAEVMPQAQSLTVASVFDAVAELQAAEYDAVFVNVEPMERRPESALRTLRQQLDTTATGLSHPRLILFGKPSLEPLSRRMLEFGGDDYLLLPPDPAELRQSLNAVPDRATAGETLPPLLPDDLPLASLVLDALLARPGAALAALLSRLNDRLAPSFSLSIVDDAAAVPEGIAAQRLHPDGDDTRHLVLDVASEADEAVLDIVRHDLSRLAVEVAKLAELDARHAQLQRLALTDELTGCYNRRYFGHFLDRILRKARRDRFAVTLLLFDIDNFKSYNDRHGHSVGDAILKQTSELIKRCVRDHDLVARIGGDEFAVVFWEKEGPRVPHHPESGSGRFPRGPLQIAARFRRLMASPEFTALGTSGQGTLTVSGGMAVYPFDAQTPQDLIDAADRALLFNAKRGDKNRIALVGDEEGLPDEAEDAE